MDLQVLKFGGSCLSDAEGFKKVSKAVRATSGNKVVVLSAVKGATDLLMSYLEDRSRPKLALFREMHLNLAWELILDGLDIERFSEVLDSELNMVKGLIGGEDEAVPIWVHDRIITSGERLAVRMLGLYLECRGTASVPLTSEEAGIAAAGEHGNAENDPEATRGHLRDTVFPLLIDGKVPIITGFYGVLPDGRAATFGRNGSDYSASVVASILQARELVLYKDVRGFMSADPAIVPDARILGTVTFEEASELSRFGAKVMHPATFGPLIGTDITIRICDLTDPISPGTRMVGAREGVGGEIGVAFRTDLSCIRLDACGRRRASEILCEANRTLAIKGVEVLSVVMSQTSVGIMVPSKDRLKAVDSLEEANIGGRGRVRSEDGLALIGLVGERLGGDPALIGKCYLALSEAGIRARLSGSGGTRTAYYIIVDGMDAHGAVRTLHGKCV